MKRFLFMAVGKFAYKEEIKAKDEEEAKEIFMERLAISTEHFEKVNTEGIKSKFIGWAD